MEKQNVVLITSVINIPNLPFSYTDTRSVYTHAERFEQTINTIDSVKCNIPDSIIFIVECSPLENDKKEYLIQNSDIFVNLYDLNDPDIIHAVFSISKSHGEGCITIYALKYLIENKIQFRNLYKISGRYWINEYFNYDVFNNDDIVVKIPINYEYDIFTFLYKLPMRIIPLWLDFLLNSTNDMHNCIGFERLFADFIYGLNHESTVYIYTLGISGMIAVDGNKIQE